MRILKNFKIIPTKDGFRRGKHCIISKYGDKILKIFTTYPQTELTEKSLNEFHWGDYEDDTRPFKQWTRLSRATVIQNICWLHNLAPRVYEIVGIEIDYEHKYFAQLQDFAEEEYNSSVRGYEKVYKEVKDLGVVYGFGIDRKDDVSKYDAINGKLVDFNTFHFYPDHLDKIKKIIIEKAKYGKVYYQDEPKLGLNGGPRKSEDRIKYMKLDELDFKDKLVLDLGCAGGYFCRYVKDRGANRVMGIDYEDVKGSDTREVAYLISWELGYYDIEFEQHDLREYKPESADIVLFLSMNYHIGIPDWLPQVTKEICIFEDNAKGFKENPEVTKETEKKLKELFKKVELIGYGEDHGNKPIYRCWK